MRTARAIAAATAILTGGAACEGPPVAERNEPSAVIWRAGAPLPQPLTNNAVAAVAADGGVSVFTFLGMDSTKTAAGVTHVAYRWDVGGTSGWRAVAPVPGPGRLAATAQVVRGRIYLFGGYTVAADGTERTLSNVDVYDPATDQWTRGAPIPVAVDDAVSGVWADSLVVLVSGWHGDRAVSDVQWYDPATDRWSRGTPIGGTPVFGHTGGVVGDQIVYIDGARMVEGQPRYALNGGDWVGEIEGGPGGSVAWASPTPHPEPGLYRAASGTLGRLVLFVGGTTNPYNYDGIGYDGTPSEPLRQVLAYAPAVGEWRNLAAPPLATMDHRTLGIAGSEVFLVGGMEAGQRVSNKVWYAQVDKLLGTIW